MTPRHYPKFNGAVMAHGSLRRHWKFPRANDGAKRTIIAMSANGAVMAQSAPRARIPEHPLCHGSASPSAPLAAHRSGRQDRQASSTGKRWERASCRLACSNCGIRRWFGPARRRPHCHVMRTHRLGPNDLQQIQLFPLQMMEAMFAREACGKQHLAATRQNVTVTPADPVAPPSIGASRYGLPPQISLESTCARGLPKTQASVFCRCLRIGRAREWSREASLKRPPPGAPYPKDCRRCRLSYSSQFFADRF
jgi:hypothetical protein